MKLTNELLEQMIEEVTGEGYWDDETGEWIDPEEEEGYEGEVRGIPGGRRAMRDIVLPQMKSPSEIGNKPVKRYPKGHPLEGKPVTKGWMDSVLARMEKEKQADIEKHNQKAVAKGQVRSKWAESKFKITKSDILEMVKEEIANVLNGE
tara:strand:+ start:1660 stop:2106 length:447 start_codon:yes stop_codon:yes gene_type:complete